MPISMESRFRNDDRSETVDGNIQTNLTELEENLCEGSPHGRITRICLHEGLDCPEQGSGYISTCDGREIYFHASSLLGVEFHRLELDSEVDFVEDEGDNGPEAVLVRLKGQQFHVNSD